MFGTVLIANRGEIALRILRTCREMGIRVAAVYSTEDRESAVVHAADVAVHIGPAPARRSYLNIAAVVEAALAVGADAIHPGYGFLSEDPDFAEVCAANGLTFIGPPATVLGQLGDKAEARTLMSAAQVPMLPGSLRPLESIDDAQRLAAQIGYPLILKAVAGGGGRGMRVVHDEADLAGLYRETRITAQSLFGDSRIYAERYLAHARHVEIQVLADAHGNAVHLGERDCSVQRRHQKLIEETPAPGLPPTLTEEMGQAAVRGALEAGYVGVGTFEFLVDREGRYYFMEVNPRIQVEHPVTEMAYGVDLVAAQLRVAAGERLWLTQADLTPNGAAIEVRINAEDPERDFAPTPGTLTDYRPAAGPFVRVDSYAFPGCRVSASYDSLVAKLIVWAPSRDEAIVRMHRALAEFHLAGKGIHTTIPFARRVLDHPLFRAGRHGTSLVETM